jgi:hypothetical protein
MLFAALPVGASAATVVLSPQKLKVDGMQYACEKYNIDGSNYFKLRDLAYLLMGTPVEFAVSYDAAANAVVIAPGLPYEPNGTELVTGADNSASAVPSPQSVWFLDAPVDTLSIYNIGGSNFFRLRDLGDLLGFTVDYDAGTNTAIVLSGGPVADFTAQAAAFDAIWNWVQDHATDNIAGFAAYSEAYQFDNGAYAEFYLVDDDMGEADTIDLVYYYTYPDGDYDSDWIYLERDIQEYSCSHSYYDIGNDGEEADFYGSLLMLPFAFSGSFPVIFDDTDGPLASSVQEYGFDVDATISFAQMLSWLDDLLRSDPELSAFAGIMDFGFIPEQLDWSALSA